MSLPVTRVTIDDSITIDCTLREEHVATVEITRHPIEDGADPTDHARKLPDRVTLEGLFSNTPIDVNEARSRGNTEAGASGYAQEQHKKLLELTVTRKAVGLLTEIRTYKNMVLTSLSTPRDSKVGDAVRFLATFEEIRFVKSEVVRLELATRPNAVPDKPIKKVEKGKQPVEEKEELTSIAKGKLNDWGVLKPGSGL